MSEGRELVRPAGLPAEAEPARDGGRRTIQVSPDEVWPAPRGAPPPRARWTDRSFFAPILSVVAISTLLLLGMIAFVALLIRLLS